MPLLLLDLHRNHASYQAVVRRKHTIKLGHFLFFVRFARKWARTRQIYEFKHLDCIIDRQMIAANHMISDIAPIVQAPQQI